MRQAARIDANQPEIVAALRNAGATVQPLHRVGQGCPDLLCAANGTNFVLEVKDGAKPPSARLLTPDQLVWHEEWAGPVHVVCSPEEALKAVGLLKNVTVAETLDVTRHDGRIAPIATHTGADK